MVQKAHSFQFLSDLSQKSKATKTDAGKAHVVSFLGVMIQQKTYYIPVEEVREIIPAPQIVAVGHAKPWVSGLLKVQGEIYSVIDAAPFVGLTLVSEKKPVAIALSVSEGNYSLMVSSVLGITRIANLQQVSNNDEFTITYQDEESTIISVLSVPSIISSSQFANISIF